MKIYHIHRVVFAALALGVSACATQSDYTTPNLTQLKQWSAENGKVDVDAGKTSTSKWWTMLHDPAINSIVTATFANNPTLDKAVAAIDEARANVRVSHADFLPNIGVSGSVTESNTSIRSGSKSSASTGQAIGHSRTTSIGPSLSWELDLFGRIRSSTLAAERRLDARTADAQSVRLSLAVQVATTVLDWRACTYSARVDADEIVSRQKTLDLTKQKAIAGFSTQADVASITRDLTSSQGALAAQQETCIRNVNALVELSGQDRDTVLALLSQAPSNAMSNAMSNTGPANPEIEFMPVPPTTTPQLPATVLLAHPSIIAAERDSSAAWSDIALARADRLPKVNLAAALTGQWISAAGSTLRQISESLTPSIDVTLFEGGQGAANVDAADTRYRQAIANLQASVRTTVKEVENALAAQQSAAARIVSFKQSAQAAAISLNAKQAQWKSGMVNLLELEDSRRQYAAAQDNLIVAAHDRATAWVQLVSATANSITLTENNEHESDTPSN